MNDATVTAIAQQVDRIVKLIKEELPPKASTKTIEVNLRDAFRRVADVAATDPDVMNHEIRRGVEKATASIKAERDQAIQERDVARIDRRNAETDAMEDHQVALAVGTLVRAVKKALTEEEEEDT